MSYYNFLCYKNTEIYKEEIKNKAFCLGPVKISDPEGSVFGNTASSSQGKGLFSLWQLAFATHLNLEGPVRWGGKNHFNSLVVTRESKGEGW